MIEIKNLSVTYPDKTKALKNVSIKVNDGEHVALIGANGAGKTSLILSMVGVIESEGFLRVGELTLSKNTVDQVREKIGVLFQNPDDQLFMPTIYDDIAFGVRNMGLTESEVDKRVNDCLKRLNIEGLKSKTSMRLSGGEKRLAALASVLVMQPETMIMDEPTAFLDPRARRNLINIINGLEKTCIIATHDLTFALETCKRMIVIKEGSIYADGYSKDMLFDKDLMEDCGVEAIEVYKI